MNPQHRKYALIAGVAVVVIALSWTMFAALSWLLRSPVPGSGAPVVPGVTAPANDNPAAPHITATLYFASADGQRLVSAQQEVPFGGSLVEQALGSRLEMSPRAVRQAPFRVLVGANMPAALVEMGYLTNAEQESQLTSAEYQDLVVQAVLDALVKFRDHLDTKAQ